MTEADDKDGGMIPAPRFSNIDWKALYRKQGVDDSQASGATDADDSMDVEDDVAELMRRANNGDYEAEQRVRSFFRSRSHHIKRYGSIGAQVRDSTIEELLRFDPVGAEYAMRNAEYIERELRTRGKTPLIRMATERVLAAHILAGAQDEIYRQAVYSGSIPAYFTRAQLECHQSFLAALEALKVAESLEKPAITGERA